LSSVPSLIVILTAVVIPGDPDRVIPTRDPA
jgi:hypothetical protein